MANQIGVNTWVWVSPPTDDNLRSIVPKVAAWGFDGVELPVENPGDWDPKRTRDLLDEHGLTAFSACAVMPPGRDLVDTDGDTIAAAQDYLIQAVDAAADVGASALGGPMYAAVGRTWQLTDRMATYRELATNLAPVVEHAASRGVSLGIEALNRFETSVLNTIDQVLEVVGLIGADHVGVMLDTFHMNIEEKDPLAAIRACGDHIAHVQASGSDRGAPGNDHIDWEGTAAALADAGYTAPVTIESFTVENDTIAKAAAIWRPLEPSQDDIATLGLATLRRVLG